MKNLLRNLAYASVIVAALAVTAHHLRGEATAQVGGQVTGYTFDGARYSVLMSNGDVYVRLGNYQGWVEPVQYIGNFFDGPAPTAAEPRSWGQIKAGR